MKEIVIVEKTWGLGVTRVETLKVNEEEEKFFEELIGKYQRVVVNDYPRITKEYRLRRLES